MPAGGAPRPRGAQGAFSLVDFAPQPVVAPPTPPRCDRDLVPPKGSCHQGQQTAVGGAPAIGHTFRRGGPAPFTAPPSLLAVTELLWGGVCGGPAGRVAGGPGPVKRCLWGGARVWACVRPGLTTSSLEWLLGGGVDRTLIG